MSDEQVAAKKPVLLPPSPLGFSRKYDAARTLSQFMRVLRNHVRALSKRIHLSPLHDPDDYKALATLIKAGLEVHDRIAENGHISDAPGWRMKGSA